jgi:hypothetical protein
MASEFRDFDISMEEYREYDFGGRVYRIDNPVKLVFCYRPHADRGAGHSIQGDCHRIVDVDGVVHCVPRPGIDGCVLRWKNKAGVDPVGF